MWPLSKRTKPPSPTKHCEEKSEIEPGTPGSETSEAWEDVTHLSSSKTEESTSPTEDDFVTVPSSTGSAQPTSPTGGKVSITSPSTPDQLVSAMGESETRPENERGNAEVKDSEDLYSVSPTSSSKPLFPRTDPSEPDQPICPITKPNDSEQLPSPMTNPSDSMQSRSTAKKGMQGEGTKAKAEVSDEVRAKWKEAFVISDKNCDGFITLDEAIPVILSLGYHVEKCDFQSFIESTNLRMDDDLDFEGFMELMNNEKSILLPPSDDELREATSVFNYESKGVVNIADINRALLNRADKTSEDEEFAADLLDKFPEPIVEVDELMREIRVTC